jgi:hypothetical protein
LEIAKNKSRLMKDRLDFNVQQFKDGFGSSELEMAANF